jgi:hypothetical protein
MPENGIIKSFAKKSGKSKPEVEKAWKGIEQSLLDQGHKKSDTNFYPMLVGALKKSLKLKEERILLDRFKKYL